MCLETLLCEKGEHIIRHWKWWLPRFIAVGCKNYATEAANLIANVKDMPYVGIRPYTVSVDVVGYRFCITIASVVVSNHCRF